MILTQYGDPIDRVIYLDEKTGMAEVEMTSTDPNRKERRDYAIHQLRADGGIKEILAAAERKRS
jgi:hypothetical protein